LIYLTALYSFFIDRCTDVFGNEFTKEKIEMNIEKTNRQYGGVDKFNVSK
jgi:hypothetical protein